MQNVNVTKQVTGLIFLLQESQAYNTIFNSLNDFAHRLGPKHLPFASKISLKEQFFLELYNCTFHPVLKYATQSLEVMLWPGSPASG